MPDSLWIRADHSIPKALTEETVKEYITTHKSLAERVGAADTASEWKVRPQYFPPSPLPSPEVAP